MDAAVHAAGQLARADILQSGEPLRFVHPVVAAVVHADVVPSDRAQAHGCGARFPAAVHAPPEAIAGHLLGALPAEDPWAVGTLVRAAAAASAEGRPLDAARYLTRSLAEPPEPDARTGVLVELGRVQISVGPADAAASLSEALDAIVDPGCRAIVSRLMADAFANQGRHADAARTLERALAGPHGTDEGLACELQAGHTALSIFGVPSTAGVAAGTRPMVLAQRALALAGPSRPHGEVVALAEQAWRGGRLLAEDGVDGSTWPVVATALSCSRPGGGCGGVTLKAVEWHLGHAYRKLGVQSRKDLEGALIPDVKVS